MNQSITSFAIIFQSIFGQILPSISYHAQAPIRLDPIVHVAQIKIAPIKKYAVSDFKAPEPAAAMPVAPSPPPAPIVQSSTANVAQSDCVSGYSSGDYYLDKIINFESGPHDGGLGGGNSCITNYLGCFGLLQACPGEPLRAACGGSPSCQIAWFQANKTGGRSWAEVWQHELAYGWW